MMNSKELSFVANREEASLSHALEMDWTRQGKLVRYYM